MRRSSEAGPVTLVVERFWPISPEDWAELTEHEVSRWRPAQEIAHAHDALHERE
jgi:hypothetical protein